MAQHLKAADRRKIQKLYLSGTKPSEIAQKMGMKPATLRQHLYREGLTKRREEMEAMKHRTARQVLESVRQRSVEDFNAVLGLLAEGQVVDAERLRDGWDLVNGASDASSLLRAKSLLLDQALRLHGVDTIDRDQGSRNQVVFIADLERVSPRNTPSQVLEVECLQPAISAEVPS